MDTGNPLKRFVPGTVNPRCRPSRANFKLITVFRLIALKFGSPKAEGSSATPEKRQNFRLRAGRWKGTISMGFGVLRTCHANFQARRKIPRRNPTFPPFFGLEIVYTKVCFLELPQGANGGFNFLNSCFPFIPDELQVRQGLRTVIGERHVSLFMAIEGFGETLEFSEAKFAWNVGVWMMDLEESILQGELFFIHWEKNHRSVIVWIYKFETINKNL